MTTKPFLLFSSQYTQAICFCSFHNHHSFGQQYLKHLAKYQAELKTLSPSLTFKESPTCTTCITLHTHPHTTKNINAFSMLLAQRRIPPKWTHSSPPTHNKWIHEALRCITLEKITFSLKDLLDTIYKIWQLFSMYTDSLTISAETSNRHLTNWALPLLFIPSFSSLSLCFFSYYLKFPLFLSFYSNTQCSKIVNTIIVNSDQPKGVCKGI